jgi:hypothetical protein
MPTIPAFVTVPLAVILVTIAVFELLAVWDARARRRELEEWLRARGLAVAPVPGRRPIR